MAVKRAFFSWNGFIFNEANQAQGFGIDHAWRNQRQQRLVGKDSTQRTGAELDDSKMTVVFTKELLEEWGIKKTPFEHYKELKKFGDNAVAAPLITGWGEILGIFTIDSVRTRLIRTADDGNWLRVEADIAWKEWVQ